MFLYVTVSHSTVTLIEFFQSILTSDLRNKGKRKEKIENNLHDHEKYHAKVCMFLQRIWKTRNEGYY